MWELYHGGWLAENIYYLGAAGCVNVGGLRIAGASGIFKDHDYHKGHFETVPYDHSTLRSAYHIRAYDVNKLMLVGLSSILITEGIALMASCRSKTIPSSCRTTGPPRYPASATRRTCSAESPSFDKRSRLIPSARRRYYSS